MVVVDDSALLLTFQYFRVKELSVLCLVCKQFNSVVGAVWRNFFPSWYKSNLTWRTEYIQYLFPVLKIYDIINAKPVEIRDGILEEFMKILVEHNYSLPVVKIFISNHIRATVKPQELWKGEKNTINKLITKFMHMVGHPYLLSTLRPIMQQVIDTNYKLDFSSGTSKITATCKLFLKGIFSSRYEYPRELREMMNFIQTEVAKKFKDKKYSSVGPLYFLRFVCPAISSPKLFGFSGESLKSDTQRMLVTVSKVLQNLPNGTQFDDSEPHLKGMNKFILEQTEECNKFLDELKVVNGGYKTEEMRSSKLPIYLKQFLRELDPPPFIPPIIIYLPPTSTSQNSVIKKLLKLSSVLD